VDAGANSRYDKERALLQAMSYERMAVAVLLLFRGAHAMTRDSPADFGSAGSRLWISREPTLVRNLAMSLFAAVGNNWLPG